MRGSWTGSFLDCISAAILGQCSISTGPQSSPSEYIPANHRVQRYWPEVNQRINYPIKRVVIEMERCGEIDMSNGLTKFCLFCGYHGYIKGSS